MTTYPVQKTESEWREELSPAEYHVLREAGTERPWSGEYVDTKDVGVYNCRACGAELFRSTTKVVKRFVSGASGSVTASTSM